MRKYSAILLITALGIHFSGVAVAQTPKPKKENAPAANASEKTAPAEDDLVAYKKHGQHSPEWDDLIASGFESFESGNYATALIFLRRAYDKGCHDPLLLLKIGIYDESQGRLKEAADLLITAAEKFPHVYPDHPQAKRIAEHVGRVLYTLDDGDRALPYLETALKNDPDNFMLNVMSGQILRLQKKPAEALARFQKAYALAPAVGMDARRAVLKELMVLTFEMENYDACSQFAAQLLTLAPGDATALSFRDRMQKRKMQQKEQETIKKIVN